MRKFRFWTERLARGMAAIFILNFVLITGAIALEACQSHEEDFGEIEKNEALESFEAVLRSASSGLSSLMADHPEVLQDKSRADGEGASTLNKGARNAMMPVVEGSKRLLKAYGVGEGFLQAEFGNADDPRIALVGLLILAGERPGKRYVANNFARALGTLGYAQVEPVLTEEKKDWVDCLIVAVGIDAAVEFLKGNVTETIAKKAIRKIATRALGFVGAAIAVYEFGSCMEWY